MTHLNSSVRLIQSNNYDNTVLNDYSQQGRRFTDEIMRSEHRAKFFSLIPFFIESRFAQKYFVLRMQVYPEAGYLKLHILRLGGVFE